MAVLTQHPTLNYATTGFDGNWTTPNNAHSSDDQYATAQPGRNKEIATNWYGFDFSGIPDGSTINSVTLRVERKVSAAWSQGEFRASVWADITVTAALSAGTSGAIGPDLQYTVSTSAGPTSDTDWVIALTGTLPTVAQLKGTYFGVRVQIAKGNNGTTYTVSVDDIDIEVNYSPAAQTISSPTGIASAEALGTPGVVGPQNIVGAGGIAAPGVGDIIASDTWTRTQSEWGTADNGGDWSGTGGDATITSEGTYGRADFSAQGVVTRRLDSVNAQNQEFYCKFKPTMHIVGLTSAEASAFDPLFRASATPQNGQVLVEVHVNETDFAWLYIFERRSGSSVQVGNVDLSGTHAYTHGDWVHMRVVLDGSIVKVRAWSDTDGSEPSTWDYNQDILQNVVSGRFELSLWWDGGDGSYHYIDVDDLMLTTLATQAIGTPEVVLAGAPEQTITTPTGIASGEAHGSATLTGEATISTPTGVVSAEAHGSPSLAPGAVAIQTPTGIATAEASGTPQVTVPPSIIESPTGIPAPGGVSSLFEDLFTRTVAQDSGWGGDWTLNSNTGMGVNGSRAYYTNSSSSSRLGNVGISVLNVDVLGTFQLAALPAPTQSYTIYPCARYSDANNQYRPRFIVSGTDDNIQCRLSKIVGGSASDVNSPVVSRITSLSTSVVYAFRVRFVGASPTKVSMKIWDSAGAEPNNWDMFEIQDSDSVLQSAGDVGLRLLPSTGYTTTIYVDDFKAETPPTATQIANDTFTDTTGTLLTAHTAEQGGLWTTRQNPTNGRLRVVSNAATVTGFLSDQAGAHLDTLEPMADGWAQALLTGGTVAQGILVARWISAGNNYEVWGYSGGVTLYRRTSGSLISLGSVTGSGSAVRLQVVGSSPTRLSVERAATVGSLGGVSWGLETTDNTAGNQADSGDVGVGAYIDEWETPQSGTVDDFSASELVAAAGSVIGTPSVEQSTPAQNINTPTGIVSAEAHGSPTLVPGAVAIQTPTGIVTGELLGTPQVTSAASIIDTPTGIVSAEAHGSPDVVAGAVSIETPTGIPSAEAHGTPTVVPGVVFVQVPTGIGTAEALGTPSVSSGGATINTPTGIASAEAHGSPTLIPGEVIIDTPTGVPSGEAHGSPSVQPGAVTIQTPSGIATEEAHGLPQLALVTSINDPTGIVSGEAFGSPTVVPGPVLVVAIGVGSGEAFGDPSLSPGPVVILSPTSIGSGEALGTPTVSSGGATIWTPTGIASAEGFGSPDLVAGGAVIESPTGIPSGEAHGAPTLVPGPAAIAASAIASAEALGVPEVSQVTSIIAIGIASEEAFGSPAIAGFARIVPTGIVSGEALGAPTLSPGGVSIVAQAIASLEAVGIPGVAAGAVAIAPLGVASLEALGIPSVEWGAAQILVTGIASAEAFGFVVIEGGTQAVDYYVAKGVARDFSTDVGREYVVVVKTSKSVEL